MSDKNNCYKKKNCYDKIWEDCNKKVSQELCCCQQGIFEALSFLKSQNAEIEIRGSRSGNPGILGSGTITTLTRDIVILSDDPNRVWILQSWKA